MVQLRGMNWTQASVTLDRFVRLCNANLEELKNQHAIIVKLQLEKDRDYERAALEKTASKRLVGQIQNALEQLLEMRADLEPHVRDQFDAKLAPSRQRIQQTLALIVPRLAVPPNHSTAPQTTTTTPSPTEWPFRPEKSTNPFDENPFEDCFTNDPIPSDYEQQLQMEAQQVHKSRRLEELKLRAEQARADADATKKLNQDIEDLNQIMVDLAQLVHSQDEMVDSIEDQVEQTVGYVQQGHRQLRQAVKSKQAKVPLVAAVVGSAAAAGPVGIAAGSAAAGIVAAVGGAVAGWFGGRFIKNKAAEES